jgi:hypothetical protein
MSHKPQRLTNDEFQSSRSSGEGLKLSAGPGLHYSVMIRTVTAMPGLSKRPGFGTVISTS